MRDSLKEISVESLRRHRDKHLAEGKFGPAETTQKAIDRKLDGETDETAALSTGRDERLHEPIDDVKELKERQSWAEYCGFAALAADYGERIDELTEDEEPSEAVLEEQTRAALAEPDEDTREITQAALSADDAVQATDRGQLSTQYVYDTYGIDPREFDDEYELRAALRDAEPKSENYSPSETVAKEEAALSVGVRNQLAHSEKSRAQFIREQYGVEPDDHDDVESLREAIREAGGYDDETPHAPNRKSAFSDPNDRI